MTPTARQSMLQYHAAEISRAKEELAGKVDAIRYATLTKKIDSHKREVNKLGRECVAADRVEGQVCDG